MLGHEMCITVVKVGTNVRNLRRPLGYTENLPALSQQYLDFKPGERLTIQTRVARYEVPPPHLRGPDISGIQLLADNHENMAMTLDGGFAQYLRLTPEMIQSGSLIRVPEGMCEIEAALIEPTACLLDCLNLSTHPEAQGPRGNIFKPGLKRGGRTAIIGSGTMAFIGAALALSYDELVPVGGARKVVMFVISQEHTDLGWKFFPEAPIEFMVNPLGTSNEDVLRKVYERYGPDMAFDDVLVAAGGPEQVALAHRMCASTGARVHVFAGTRGTVALESGFWHYGNAATSGTSGCNTRAMENVMGMIRRGLKLARFSGKAYTLKELSPDPSPFFADLFLRPLLRPNEGLPEVRFEEA